MYFFFRICNDYPQVEVFRISTPCRNVVYSLPTLLIALYISGVQGDYSEVCLLLPRGLHELNWRLPSRRSKRMWDFPPNARIVLKDNGKYRHNSEDTSKGICQWQQNSKNIMEVKGQSARSQCRFPVPPDKHNMASLSLYRQDIVSLFSYDRV